MRPVESRAHLISTSVAAEDYPPIADYALVADSHAAALGSRSGSVDWCCMPRFDSGSCFARLLVRDKGGFCRVEPNFPSSLPPSRSYLDGTLVLETMFNAPGGHARLIDCFTITGSDPEPGRPDHWRELVRIIEGDRGTLDFTIRIEPRF